MKSERRHNFIAGFVAVLALLGVVASSDWRYVVRTRATAERVDQAQQVRVELARVLSQTVDIETGARGFVVTGEPAYLEVALVAAEAAATAKSQFLACMSHKLRTPLNAVIGMTQLLLDTPLSEQQTEFARMSNMGGETLLTLINDILDYSKLEAGKMELEFSSLDLLRRAEDCAKLGWRDSRPRDGRNRGAGGARWPTAHFDAPHQRFDDVYSASDRHRRRTLPARVHVDARCRAASGAPNLHELPPERPARGDLVRGRSSPTGVRLVTCRTPAERPRGRSGEQGGQHPAFPRQRVPSLRRHRVLRADWHL